MASKWGSQRTNQGACPNNLPSALSMPEIVSAKLQKELSLGRMAGPFDSPPFDDFAISPIDLVPKKTPR